MGDTLLPAMKRKALHPSKLRNTGYFSSNSLNVSNLEKTNILIIVDVLLEYESVYGMNPNPVQP